MREYRMRSLWLFSCRHPLGCLFCFMKFRKKYLKTFFIPFGLFIVIFCVKESSFDSDFLISKKTKNMVSFISNLPHGDITSEKCKDLVDDEQTQVNYTMSLFRSMSENSKIKKDKYGFAQSRSVIKETKYIYSNKLCLVLEELNRYDNLVAYNYSTSTAMFSSNQIIDLGSNQVIAVDSYDDISGKHLYLWNKEQKEYFDVSDLWSKIIELK